MHRSCGKRHYYLVIWLYYSIPGEVHIFMEEYLRLVLHDFLEEVTETPESSTAAKRFDVRDDNKRELLDEKRAQALHHAVAQLPFTGI